MPLNLGAAPVPKNTHGTPAPTDPFRLAVLADFSGRGGDPDALKPVPLNLDDIEGTLAKLNPTVTLNGLPGDPTLVVQSLDDFEPDALVRAVDHFSDLSDEDEKAEFLGRVLRHPNLRRAEGVWRGVDWLARRGRKGGRAVEVVLYDLSADRFAAALAGDELAAGPLYRRLVDEAVFGKKGQPWAAVVGLYDFDLTAAHAALLGRAARTFTDSGGPFLAGLSAAATDPTAAVPAAAAEAWAELRGRPEAGLLGLAAPRFLARRPFGADYRGPEAFAFEEFRADDVTESYPWAPAALIPAGVLAQGYVADGWGFTAQGTRTLEDMATHPYTDADDDEHLTLLDRWLDRQAAERLTGLGVMTTHAVKGADACQLTRLHSLGAGKPPAELYGRWGKSGSAGPPRSRFGAAAVIDTAMTGSAPRAAVAAPMPAAVTPGAGASDPSSVPNDLASDGGDDPAALDTPVAPPPADEPPPAGVADDLDAMLAALAGPADAPPPTDTPAEESLDDMLKRLSNM